MNVFVNYSSAYAFHIITKAIGQKPSKRLRTANTSFAMYVKILANVLFYKIVGNPCLVIVNSFVAILVVVGNVPKINV